MQRSLTPANKERVMAGKEGGAAIGLCGSLALLAGCAGVNRVAPNVDAMGMPNAELALQRGAR